MSAFNPTKEQKDILLAFKKGKNIKIHAFAGTGKTTTLEYLARKTKNKGLYIAFNKRIATEARKKMPDNIDASTIHSLAWKWASEKFAKEKLLQSPNRALLKKSVPIPSVNGFSEYKTITTLSLVLKNYCNSRDEKISSKHLPWGHLSYLSEQEVLERNADILVATAQSAWEKMGNPESDLPLGHDGYLKHWSLKLPVLDYDFLFIDEAQDLSPVMLEVIDNFGGQKIFVGDSQQQIYSWRGAVDAMRHEIIAEEHFLTNTFRFGNDLSNLANRVLRSLLVEKRINSHSDTGTSVETISDQDANAFIFRKNATLIAKAVELYTSDKPFYIVDPNKNIEQSVQDYFRLNDGLWGKSQAFEGYNSWSAVVSIAKKEEDNPFRGFVELFESNDPNIILKAIKSSKKREGKSYPSLTTGHQAKGLEWDSVKLSSDFEFPTDALNLQGQEEELRLLYVAMTRARKILDMPHQLKDFCEKQLGHSPQKFAVIDLETTGLDPDYGDRITEIGFVIWQNGKIIKRYQSLINPERTIPSFVQELTGITDNMVRNAPSSREVLSEAMEILGDTPLVAHNASFERKFLNNELKLISRNFSVDLICTLLLSRRVFPNLSSYKLGNLVSEFNLPKGKAHRALSDAEMTTHLLSEIHRMLLHETDGKFLLTADNLLRLTKVTPKYFRENGIDNAVLMAQNKYLKTTYSSHDFSKEFMEKSNKQSKQAELKRKLENKHKPKKTIPENTESPDANFGIDCSINVRAQKPNKKSGQTALKNLPNQKPKSKIGLLILGLGAFIIGIYTIKFIAYYAVTIRNSSALTENEIQTSPARTGIVTASELRQRKCPSTDCEVIGSSLRGQRVIIVDERDGWYKISPPQEINKDQEHWVSSDYVKTVANTQ